MLFKIVAWYTSNKGKIWKTILIVALVLIIIRVANSLLKNVDTYGRRNLSNEISVDNTQKQSIVTDTSISEEMANQNNKAIQEFVDYCNSGKIESAYNMLSDECKEVLFPSMEDFINKYYSKIFTTYKVYRKDNWTTDSTRTTYIITYEEDALTTGGESDNSFNDYITAVNETGNITLNLGSFIKKEELNKTYDDDNIRIELLSRVVYMDYERYEVNITNKSKNMINIYSQEDGSEWYLALNNYKYSADISYLINDYISKIGSGEKKAFSMNFDKSYNPKKSAKSMVFENIVINNEKSKIEIDL